MSADGRVDRYADFGDAPGVPMPQTWQVPRATFDQLLLRHAAASGADVRQGCRVLDVAVEAGGGKATIQATNGTSAAHAVRGHAVLDASGRGSVLSRKLPLRS